MTLLNLFAAISYIFYQFACTNSALTSSSSTTRSLLDVVAQSDTVSCKNIKFSKFKEKNVTHCQVNDMQITLGHVLGKGSFGIVYEVTNFDDTAIKFVQNQRHKKASHNVENENIIMKSLINHDIPNVGEIIDSLTDVSSHAEVYVIGLKKYYKDIIDFCVDDVTTKLHWGVRQMLQFGVKLGVKFSQTLIFFNVIHF